MDKGRQFKILNSPAVLDLIWIFISIAFLVMGDSLKEILYKSFIKFFINIIIKVDMYKYIHSLAV